MTTSNGYASRDAFLAPAKRRFKDIVLPVSKLKLRIRSLFEGEKEAFEASLMTAKGDVSKNTLIGARRRLVVLCLVDGNGDLILSDADIESMKQLDGADLAHMQDECQTFCGFKEGDIEGLVKNSETVHVGS
jgi:hypothetical protein